MNFQLTGTGHSFKGSMTYFLHDKRQEGQERIYTADRVAWTETRNLATDGPHTATRIMIATASQADELKRAAGVKNTGRKATGGPVFSFSLAWHPSEAADLERGEMVGAADHALKVLGLDHLQSVIVAHQDTAHPHVHVIVNRVDPTNGKTTPIRKPAVIELDKWADRYERERGQIVSPNRAKKHDEQERKRKAHPDPEKRKKYIQDRDAARKKEPAAAAFDRAADPKPAAARADALAQPVSRNKTPAAMLKELGDAVKARHRQEWVTLAADQRARRAAAYQAHGQSIKQAWMQAKAQNRPQWAELFRQQREARKIFDNREQRLADLHGRYLAAITSKQISGDGAGRGLLSASFELVNSSQQRTAAFVARQAEDRAQMAAALKAQTAERIRQMQAVAAREKAQARQGMAAERAALIEWQNAERAKVREAWRQLNLQRGRKPQVAEREKPTMREFDKAASMDAERARQLSASVRRSVATPAPAPVPAGMVQPPARSVQDVPKIDRAAEWAKTAQGRAALAKDAPAPPARQQFGRAVEPKPEPHTQAPAQEAAKTQSRADYWNERAKAADRPQKLERDRSLNRDFDRER